MPAQYRWQAVGQRAMQFHVSPDGHGTTLDAGKYYVELNVIARTSSNVTMAFWNRGSGRSDQQTSLGPVTGFDRSDAYCFRNRRFEMCASEYLTCKCGPEEYYGASPPTPTNDLGRPILDDPRLCHFRPQPRRALIQVGEPGEALSS
jgi:hypothetical protein